MHEQIDLSGIGTPVGVDHHDDVAACGGEAGAEGRALPALRLMDDDDVGDESTGDDLGLVRREPVDEDDLRDRLGQMLDTQWRLPASLSVGITTLTDGAGTQRRRNGTVRPSVSSGSPSTARAPCRRCRRSGRIASITAAAPVISASAATSIVNVAIRTPSVCTCGPLALLIRPKPASENENIASRRLLVFCRLDCSCGGLPHERRRARVSLKLAPQR